MISSRRFFFPESCVRQFAEPSGKETFTAWARTCHHTADVVPTRHKPPRGRRLFGFAMGTMPTRQSFPSLLRPAQHRGRTVRQQYVSFKALCAQATLVCRPHLSSALCGKHHFRLIPLLVVTLSKNITTNADVGIMNADRVR
jgi:hypothetical protein